MASPRDGGPDPSPACSLLTTMFSSPGRSFHANGAAALQAPHLLFPPDHDEHQLVQASRIVEIPEISAGTTINTTSLNSTAAVSSPICESFHGGAVAPESPPDEATDFVAQEREQRENNFAAASATLSLGMSSIREITGLRTTSLKATRLFLSHCWRDVNIKTQKEEMFSHLTKKGCMFWADFLDLQEEGAVEWRKEIADAIRGCSKFVAFVDYQYLLSFNCLEEMAFALHEQKPIVLSIMDQGAWDILTSVKGAQKAWNAQPSTGLPLSGFEGKPLWPSGAPFSLKMLEEIFTAMGNINFCPCRGLDIALQGRDQVHERLFRFLEKNIEYAKEYADLKQRAHVWEASGRPKRLLLSGEDTRQWPLWVSIADKIKATPSPTPSQREYVRASIQRRKLQTKLRLGALAVALALILLGALASVVMAFRAEHERGVAEQQRAIAEDQKAEAELQGAVASTLLLSADRKPYTTAAIRAQNLAAYRAESFGIPEVVLPALHDTIKYLLNKPYQFLDFEGHRAKINSVDFSPSGSSLLSTSKDGTVIVWPISWDPSALVPDFVEPFVLNVDFSFTNYCVLARWMDEDTFAAAFEGGQFQVWRKHAAEGWKAELRASPHDNKVVSMAVSRDGLKVATGVGKRSKSKKIAVWSFDEANSRLGEHSASFFPSKTKPFAMVFSPDGRYLIFEYEMGALSYADTDSDLMEDTIALLAELPSNTIVTALAFSPGGRFLAVGLGEGTALLIDWNKAMSVSNASNALVHSIISPMPTTSSFQIVAGLAWSSESTLIVAADVGTVSFWEIPQGNEETHSEPVLLREMVYQTMAMGAPIHVTGVTFSDKIGGGTIAMSSEDSMLRLWHPTPQLGLQGALGYQMQMAPGRTSKIRAVVWSKTRMAACSNEGQLGIWELKPVTGDWLQAAAVTVTDGAMDDVVAHCRSLRWAPDESMVAAGLNENVVEVWQRQDNGTWALVMYGAAPGAVRKRPDFSPDSRWLAVPGKYSPEIYLFHVPSHVSAGTRDGEPVQPDLILSHDEGEIKSVAWAPFSPSGVGSLVLASSGDDNTRLWDLSDAGTEESVGLTIEGSTILTELGFPYAIDMDWSVDGRLFAKSHVEGLGGVWHWQSGLTNSSDNNAGAWASLLQVGGHTGTKGDVSWSPDGSQLVIPFNDNTLRIYNVNDQAGFAEVLYQIEQRCEWLEWLPVSLESDSKASRIACANTVGAAAPSAVKASDFTVDMLLVNFAEQRQLLQRMTYGHLTARDLQIMRLERLQDQVLPDPAAENNKST